MDEVIKAAKKILKKNEEGSMKVKQLAKAVLEKIANEDGLKSSQVKDWILGSDKFSVDGKVVSLNSSKKRKEMDSESNGNYGDVEDEKAKKKAAKRAKKESKKKKKESEKESVPTTFSDDITLDEGTKWRKENKVVLKVTQDGDNGVAASKALNSNEIYLPYNSFTSARCIENIDSTLLAQCTKVNGFKTPSAIQAQCWPVLLHSDNGKKRDIVG